MIYTYEYEYVSNLIVFKKILSRGVVSMPDLAYYGYDGYRNYSRSDYHKARNTFKRELIKKVKAELGLTGVKGRVYDYCDSLEFKPYRSNKTLFITLKD